MDQPLSGKVVVVTGANGQIGRSTALRLSELGARLIGIVRSNFDEAQLYYDSLPNNNLKHKIYLASITDTLAIQKIVADLDRCDILINAAGVNNAIRAADFEQMSDDQFDEIIITNIRGTFAVIREFVPLLKLNESLIINLSSQSSQRASTSNIAYAASKAAIDLLTKSLARSLSPDIRVVAINPGHLETATSGLVRTPEQNYELSKKIPLGRVGTGDDVANLIVSLATTVTYMTGNVILLDGGNLC